MNDKLLGAAIVAIFVSNTCVAQSVLASNDGMRTYFAPTKGCARHVQLIADAEEPYLFFDRNRLEGLVAATRIALSLECATMPDSIHLTGQHDGQYLGYMSVNGAGGWKVFFKGDLRFDPLWQASGVFDSGNSPAPTRGAPRGTAANASVSIPFRDRKFFYAPGGLASHSRFGQLQAFASKTENGLRYTSMSKYLAGENYLFYPYTAEDSTHTVDQPILADALPSFGVSIDANGVAVSSGTQSENAPLRQWLSEEHTPEKSVGPECFHSQLMHNIQSEIYPGGYCFMIVQKERDREFHYFLASPYRAGQNNSGLTILGKLKPVSPQKLQQELAKTTTRMASTDGASTTTNQSTPAISSYELQRGLRIENMRVGPYIAAIYSGDFDKVDNALSDGLLLDLSMIHQAYVVGYEYHHSSCLTDANATTLEAQITSDGSTETVTYEMKTRFAEKFRQYFNAGDYGLQGIDGVSALFGIKSFRAEVMDFVDTHDCSGRILEHFEENLYRASHGLAPAESD